MITRSRVKGPAEHNDKHGSGIALLRKWYKVKLDEVEKTLVVKEANVEEVIVREAENEAVDPLNNDSHEEMDACPLYMDRLPPGA